MDNLMVLLIAGVLIIGAILTTTASPAVAERLKIGSFYFVYRQFLFLALAIAIIWFTSNLNEVLLKRVVLVGTVVCLIMMVLVLIFGQEVKGAKRWISIAGISLQPSEIIKPFYFVITGLVLSEKYNRKNFPGFTIAAVMHLVLCSLLILQPDFGMVITFTAVLAGQFFLAGLPIIWVVVGIIGGGLGIFLAYHTLPHVAKRVDSFLNPEANENYQVEKSLEAYVNGGIFGKGPGEGTVKSHLPDSHTDFIFAVAGEEFGAFFSMFIIVLFALLVIRGIFLIMREENLFKVYTCSAIMMLFALQTIFNVGVTLNLFPTKGMTLPFISYGGSSVISFAFAFGIFLNLTRYNRTLNVSREIIYHHKR